MGILACMKLRDYLRKEEITPTEFATMVGASKDGVTKWIYGQRMPRKDMLEKIAQKTNGAVLANDFMSAA